MIAANSRHGLSFFVNASLSSLGEQRLNEELADLIRRAGHHVYLPQREVPIGSRASAAEILSANTKAVMAADVVLAVLDKPGVGVAFELGVAYAARKRIVLFRSDRQDYLGKVLEGFWDSHPSEFKATTLEELTQVVSRLGSS